MTKLIRNIIGVGAIVVLSLLSILIGLTVKFLDALGVDISDHFKCELKVNDKGIEHDR